MVDLSGQNAVLRQHDIRVDHLVCATLHANRDYLRQVAAATAPRISIPPLTARDCP